MTKPLSVYLDLIRFLAAAVVVIFHATNHFPDLVGFKVPGHEAVIVFFVLSGFVIAFVSKNKEHNLSSFAQARITRILSVAIPAIFLTILFDTIGNSLSPHAYADGYDARDYPLVRILSSLTFTNELWFLSIQSFSNVPYWSLNYEVWYYAIFAAWAYTSPRIRLFPTLLLCLIAGPKILLLLPIWWMGVYAFRTNFLSNSSRNIQMLTFVVSLAGIGAYFYFNLGEKGWNYLLMLFGDSSHKALAFSRQFLTDYFLGIFFTLHLISIKALFNSSDNSKAIPLETIIRYFASCTFSLYLLHQPLLLLFISIGDYFEATQASWVVLLTFATSIALAHITERKKNSWKGISKFIVELLNINAKWGTYRGLIRCTISSIKNYLGHYSEQKDIDFGRVERIVFICQGNICRSAFAEHYARSISNVQLASAGLATTAELPANEIATSVAKEVNISMDEHKTTCLQDMQLSDKDLLVIMEDRQIAPTQEVSKGSGAQITLLGLWSTPNKALIYDPFSLSKDYFRSCFEVISNGTKTLTNKVSSSK